MSKCPKCGEEMELIDGHEICLCILRNEDTMNKTMSDEKWIQESIDEDKNNS